jgi:PAS domain S-box-containing protein
MQAALAPGRKVMEQIKEHTNKMLQTEVQLLSKEQRLKERYRYVTPLFALLLITFAFIVFTIAYIYLIRQFGISRAYLQQKHRALEDLKEMNVIYLNAEEVANLGSWQWNLQTNLFKCSDNLFRIYGSEPRQEEISFNRFMSFVVPEDREKLVKTISRAIDHKEAAVATYRIVRSDHVIRHMRAYGKMRADSHHIMLGATQDVTEVTEAVEKLKASESFNRNITELVPNIIYIYDLETRTMLYLNKDIRDILGFTYDELTTPGFDFYRLFDAEDLVLAAKRQERFRLLKEGDVVASEYRIKHKNGEWKYIYARNTCFKRDKSGAVTQIIGVASDVTDMKRTNEKLSAVNKELAEKNRELLQSNEDLSSFNFIASHDLQEPLRKIQTFVSFLEESEPNLSETGKFYLQRMQYAASRIRALIQDLLSYAHATSQGKEWSDVDLNVVLKNVLQSLHELIQEKKANIEVHQLPVVKGNISQLHELFEHLLNNAFKYHKPGQVPEISISSETITIGHDGVPELEVGRVYYKISIADEGIGFEQEYAGKIFGLFQKLHAQEEEVGSGIGLAICKKIVQYHGGTIEARSVPDEGSVFDVYLPA